MAEDTVIKLKFKDDFKSPTLEIGHGEYDRKFNVKDQPFEVSGLTRKVLDENEKPRRVEQLQTRTVKNEKGEDVQERTTVEVDEERVIVTPEEERAILLSTGHFEEIGEDQTTKAKAQNPKLAATGKIGGAQASSGE